jgi:hypothetical protein
MRSADRGAIPRATEKIGTNREQEYQPFQGDDT